jgi:DNA repair protein RecO (recombination protein O)
MKKITQDAAFILHHYDWSESSLIVDVFSRQMGRVSLVAKGAKKPTSNFRAVLLPLQRLELAYSLPAADSDGDIGTLKAAHWASRYTLPQGDALLAGFYTNELLLKLLARHDAQPALFDVYASCVALLAHQGKAAALQPALQGLEGLQGQTALILRGFELLLLHGLGLLPALHSSASGHDLQQQDPTQHFYLQAERGLCLAEQPPERAHSLPAVCWLQLDSALQAPQPFTALLPALLSWPAAQRTALRNSLRHVLHQHIGSPLKTRQLMATLQGL